MELHRAQQQAQGAYTCNPPPAVTPSHSITPLLSVGPDGDIGLAQKNTTAQKWKHGNMQETVDLKKNQTNGAADGLIIWKVNLIGSVAEGANGNYEPVQTWR